MAASRRKPRMVQYTPEKSSQMSSEGLEERERPDRRDERDEEQHAEDPAVPLVVGRRRCFRVRHDWHAPTRNPGRKHGGDLPRPSLVRTSPDEVLTGTPQLPSLRGQPTLVDRSPEGREERPAMWQPTRALTLVGASVALIAASQGAAATPTQTSTEYIVGSLTVPGVDTGLVLKKGRPVTVTATGTVCPSTGFCTTPDGVSPSVVDTYDSPYPAGYVLPGAPAYGLVARVGKGPW